MALLGDKAIFAKFRQLPCAIHGLFAYKQRWRDFNTAMLLCVGIKHELCQSAL